MFKITGGKGFHVTFENGWTVSVQFGRGNYSGNYNLHGEGETPPSDTAEVAAWRGDEWHEFDEEQIAGWQTPAQVLAIMNLIAAKE